MSRNSYEEINNKFYLKDDQGHLFDLYTQSMETAQNNYNKYTLASYDSIEISVEYQVMCQHARGMVPEYSGIVEIERSDEQFFYDGNDLGYTYDKGQTVFVLWASATSRVKLRVCRSNCLYAYEMRWTDKGVYRYTILENLENATYVYLVRVNDIWRGSIDPCGIASIENSHRSAVIDLDKIRVCDVPLLKMTSACDTITCEASVHGFTMQRGVGATMPGKFRGSVGEDKTTKQQCSGFSYLKTLGITHIQLMPVTDFGSVDENYPLMHYNQGYDSVQYHVLEGNFSTEPTSPYGRMFELIELMEECHKQGTHVDLDIVFNHVYDKETHVFGNTVPNYYSQMNENGDFPNGTYCGDDVDPHRNIHHKHIAGACTYLARTYRTDGFRFDLMGILDVAAISAVYEACKAFNPDFTVYGEDWDMPSSLDSGKHASIPNNAQMSYVVHFPDRFQSAVKRHANTNEVSVKGCRIGAVYLLDIMKSCLSGSCASIRMEPVLIHLRNAVNYVERHDNMTSWGKLKECCKEDSKEVRITRAKMLMMAVLLTQGIPFIYSGRKFIRSKHRLSNVYEGSDEINKLDYLRKNRCQDMVKATKGLIRIREEYPILRYSMKESVKQRVSSSNIVQEVLLYKIRDEYDDMVIIFSPTGECFPYEFEAAYPLLYYNGVSEDTPTREVNTEPYSTIVLSQNDFLKPGIR